VPTTNPAEARLRSTILRLAAGSSVDSISVAELCRVAEVTRETFYQYARNPAALLASILDEELETFAALSPALTEHVEGGARTVMDRPTVELLEHVRRNEAIYLAARKPRLNAALRDVLIRRVEHLLREYADRYPQVLPVVDGRPVSSDEVDMLVAFAASGVVGSIESAIGTGILADVERAASLVFTTSAPWWLGRSRSHEGLNPQP
jgi:AcrR family transcriptional regulator